MLEELLALQGLDTAMNQANHRLMHLAEIETRRECMETVAGLEQHVRELEDGLAAAAATLADGERVTRDIDGKVQRLEGQLKTVIAPREAEALQHEIATLRREREESDERGLAALVSSEELGHNLARSNADLAAARVALETVVGELRVAQEVVHAELEQLAQRRSEKARIVGDDLLARYERQRKQSSRVVVAALKGSSCGGCHLDLSQLEKDELRRLPAGDIPECPHCGCMLVL